MGFLRPFFPKWVLSSDEVAHLPDGAELTVAGLVIRRQRQLGIRHHKHPGVGWAEGTVGGHAGLSRWHGIGLALRPNASPPRTSAEMLREAVFRRFGEARVAAQGIEFLSDNGPEYTSHRFRPFVQAMGLVPCHTPRRSPESNGLAEAFFGSFKRDYVYQAYLETLDEVGGQVPNWIEHYNHQAPHSALGMQSPAEFYTE